MIKLIATDIDGTIVKDGTLLINQEYMTVIAQLIRKGILFVICSGRQFSSEEKPFRTNPRSAALYFRWRNCCPNPDENPAKPIQWKEKIMERNVPDGSGYASFLRLLRRHS